MRRLLKTAHNQSKQKQSEEPTKAKETELDPETKRGWKSASPSSGVGIPACWENSQATQNSRHSGSTGKFTHFIFNWLCVTINQTDNFWCFSGTPLRIRYVTNVANVEVHRGNVWEWRTCTYLRGVALVVGAWLLHRVYIQNVLVVSTTSCSVLNNPKSTKTIRQQQ